MLLSTISLLPMEDTDSISTAWQTLKCPFYGAIIVYGDYRTNELNKVCEFITYHTNKRPEDQFRNHFNRQHRDKWMEDPDILTAAYIKNYVASHTIFYASKELAMQAIMDLKKNHYYVARCVFRWHDEQIVCDFVTCTSKRPVNNLQNHFRRKHPDECKANTDILSPAILKSFIDTYESLQEAEDAAEALRNP